MFLVFMSPFFILHIAPYHFWTGMPLFVNFHTSVPDVMYLHKGNSSIILIQMISACVWFNKLNKINAGAVWKDSYSNFIVCDPQRLRAHSCTLKDVLSNIFMNERDCVFLFFLPNKMVIIVPFFKCVCFFVCFFFACVFVFFINHKWLRHNK